MFYVIAFDNFWCDEYGFDNYDDLLKFMDSNKSLTFGPVHRVPILIDNSDLDSKDSN